MPEVYREQADIVEIGSNWLARLKRAAAESPLRRSRVCLHPHDDAAVHEMVLVLCQDVLFRPHRHLNKAESFHMIEGELDLVIFDEHGSPLRVIELGAAGTGQTFCYRLNRPLFHALLPRTPYVVFHETTSGPFRKDEAQFAPWAPQQPDELRRFLECAAIRASRGGGFAKARIAQPWPGPTSATWPPSAIPSPSLVHSNVDPTTPERVAILGANGFLGRAIRQRLDRDRVEVLPISSKDLDLTAPDAGASLASLLRPTDALIFLATVTPGRQLDENALAANIAIGAAVCTAVRKVGCGHLLYVSTDAIYPYDSIPVEEKVQPAVSSLYGLMHLSREHMVSQLESVPVAILRLTQVYGAGETHNAYGPNRMVRSAVGESRIVLFGFGEETRDHIYINDVTSAIVDVLMMRSRGLVNVASGRSVSFADLAALVEELCGGVTIEHQPRRMPVLHRSFRTAELDRAFPDRLQTQLRQGIAQMIEHERMRKGADLPAEGQAKGAVSLNHRPVEATQPLILYDRGKP